MRHHISSLPVICGLATLIVLGIAVELLFPRDWEGIKLLAFTGVIFLSAFVGYRVGEELND